MSVVACVLITAELGLLSWMIIARPTGASNNSFWLSSEPFCRRLRQTKVTLFTNKANLSFLPDNKNFLLVAQKQLLEPALINEDECIRCSVCHGVCPTDAVRHDGERIPLDVEDNIKRVDRLLEYYNTVQEQRGFLERMERYFNKQSKVASLSAAEVAAKRSQLS